MSKSKRWISAALLVVFSATVPTREAWAMRSSTVVWRATGSGAILGLGAGIVSYPFAKSSGTLVAGVMLGAILGAAYGFYLVDRRKSAYPVTIAEPTLAEELAAMNAERDGRLRRPEFTVGVPVPIWRF